MEDFGKLILRFIQGEGVEWYPKVEQECPPSRRDVAVYTCANGDRRLVWQDHGIFGSVRLNRKEAQFLADALKNGN